MHVLMLVLCLLLVPMQATAGAFTTPQGTSGVEQGSSSQGSGDFTTTNRGYTSSGLAPADERLGSAQESRIDTGSRVYTNAPPRYSGVAPSVPPVTVSTTIRVREEGWGLLNVLGLLLVVSGLVLLGLMLYAMSLGRLRVPLPTDRLTPTGT